MNRGQNRRQLRGCILDRDCGYALTVREFNGDNVCGGLHYDEDSFFLREEDVTEKCKSCGAWHANWRKSERCTYGKILRREVGERKMEVEND